MRLLGKGRAKDFSVHPPETCVEIGKLVYAAQPSDFCSHCEGAGCKSCRWTGHSNRKGK